jgi:hypothetical protein
LKERTVVVQSLLKKPPETNSRGTTDNADVSKSEKQKVFTIDLGEERVKSEPGVEERLDFLESSEAKETRSNFDGGLTELSSL